MTQNKTYTFKILFIIVDFIGQTYYLLIIADTWRNKESILLLKTLNKHFENFVFKFDTSEGLRDRREGSTVT